MQRRSVNPGELIQESSKRWQHRTVDPSATLLRMAPLLPVFGITRVADLTGLDRIGIPVYQAVRPLGRLLTVSQGKGVTKEAAKASAIMEATEIWHAENLRLGRLSATYAQLAGEARIDPRDYAKPGAGEPIADKAILWTTARDIVSGNEVYVPRDVASLDFTRTADPPWLMRNTIGLASGNTPAESQASALAEVIEHACRFEFRNLNGIDRAQRRLDPRTLARENEAIAGTVEPILAAGLDLDLFDLTNDLRVSAIRATLYDCHPMRRVYRPSFGHGAHLDPVTAILRAVTEAAQARLTYISGIRDDLDPDHFVPSFARNLALSIERKSDLCVNVSHFDLSDQSGVSPQQDIDKMIQRIEAHASGPVLFLDLSHPEIGVPVAKVLVPGLTKKVAARS